MKYLIEKKDGSVAIMITTSDDINVLDEMDKFDKEHKELINSVSFINEDDIPEDMYFREAWMYRDEKIIIDLDKAREVHRNVLRVLRNPKLQALDIEFMKAVEQFDEEEQALIRVKKEELRNMTQDPGILNAQTPEELKLFMPECLK